MNEKKLPAAAEFVLTRRSTCALLAIVAFSSQQWALMLGNGVPLLASLLLLLGMVLHALIPGLFALITLGGGMMFAIQAGLIASLGIFVLSGFLPGLAMVFLTLFVAVPILGATVIRRAQGVGRSAAYIALGMGLAVASSLVAEAAEAGSSVRELVESMLLPMFDLMSTWAPAGDKEWIRHQQELMVTVFPGLLALTVWMIWWGNVLLARMLAIEYGFYSGDRKPVLHIRFGKSLAYAAAALIAITALGDGDIKYLAGNAALLAFCLITLQGVAVAHLWITMRNLQVLLIMMYLLLMFWPVAAIPFALLGLLDIWFDYRRNFSPALGG